MSYSFEKISLLIKVTLCSPDLLYYVCKTALLKLFRWPRRRHFRRGFYAARGTHVG